MYHTPPDVVVMTWVMRLLARGSCYHCRDESRPKPANRFRLRYCPDWQACGERMQAQGKRAVPAGQRMLFEEVPGD
jgi:hypothetical protein